MWQYYKVALIGNEWQLKVVVPDGWKLMEHSYYWSRTMNRIEKLLYREAYNVMRIWDYAQCASFVWKHKAEDEEEISYDRKLHPTEILDKNPDLDYFLINKSKFEYINMTWQEMNKDLQNEYWRVVHPLPILCRAEWEFWWGDYYGKDAWNKEYMWIWSWDIIHIAAWKKDLMELELKELCYKDMSWIYMFKEY